MREQVLAREHCVHVRIDSSIKREDYILVGMGDIIACKNYIFVPEDKLRARDPSIPKSHCFPVGCHPRAPRPNHFVYEPYKHAPSFVEQVIWSTENFLLYGR